MATENLLLRPATRDDLSGIADLFLAARAAAVPAMPPVVRGGGAVRTFIATWDVEDPASREVWVAETEAGLTGYAVLKSDWLDALYVHPGWSGTGVGSALLDLMKSVRPEGFCLWVFESNEPARRFYAERGLTELERTDGSGNEEGAPDIRMAWPGADPLGFYRAQIDEIDEQLGELLGRRAALTRAVQPHKAHAGRDPVREREIAEAFAVRAPALGPERLHRIIEAIITESLDAARHGPG